MGESPGKGGGVFARTAWLSPSHDPAKEFKFKGEGSIDSSHYGSSVAALTSSIINARVASNRELPRPPRAVIS